MKKLLGTSVVLIIIWLLSLNNKDNIISSKDVERVKVSYNNEIIDIDIDEYTLGVLACEMPALFHEEALKAGSVAIRTFYYYKKSNDEKYVAKTTDQCFISKEDMKEKWKEKFDEYYSKLNDIVVKTNNELITYDGNIIESFYYSLSNGKSENIVDVFNREEDYLVSVDSSYDINVKNFETTKRFTKSEFYNLLNLDYSDNLLISNILLTSSNRIKSLYINDYYFEGITLRKLLGLRSNDFIINDTGEFIDITTRGYGHGVGMSQYGANEMAKLGFNYKDIIKHYYTGVEIENINV